MRRFVGSAPAIQLRMELSADGFVYEHIALPKRSRPPLDRLLAHTELRERWRRLEWRHGGAYELTDWDWDDFHQLGNTSVEQKLQNDPVLGTPYTSYTVFTLAPSRSNLKSYMVDGRHSLPFWTAEFTFSNCGLIAFLECHPDPLISRNAIMLTSSEGVMRVHLRQLHTGARRPDVRTDVLECVCALRSGRSRNLYRFEIFDDLLALSFKLDSGAVNLVIWQWRIGALLVVSVSVAKPLLDLNTDQ